MTTHRFTPEPEPHDRIERDISENLDECPRCGAHGDWYSHSLQGGTSYKPRAIECYRCGSCGYGWEVK